MKSLSPVRLFATPGTVAHQAPPSWDFPGKNTAEGCHFLLQGIFPTQGLNPGLLHYRQTLYYLSHQVFSAPTLISKGHPRILKPAIGQALQTGPGESCGASLAHHWGSHSLTGVPVLVNQFRHQTTPQLDPCLGRLTWGSPSSKRSLALIWPGDGLRGFLPHWRWVPAGQRTRGLSPPWPCLAEHVGLLSLGG